MSTVDAPRAECDSSLALLEGYSSSTLDLPSDPASVRHVVRDRCEALGFAQPTLDRAVLLTSELVTNAIVHTGGPVKLRVTASDRSVDVEVQNGGAQELVRPRLSAPGATSGRGLFMVAELADSWGIIPTLSGKTIWFTLERR